MAPNWTYMYAAGQDANSKVKDKFAMTVLPRGGQKN
jgi:hypothetical protein